MSKPNISFRIPKNLRDEVDDIKEDEGIEDRSEAARQVLWRGIEKSREKNQEQNEQQAPETTAGERLTEIATAVSGVGAVVAVIGALIGGAWAMTLAMPFTISTFVFAMFWASIRALRGGGLV